MQWFNWILRGGRRETLPEYFLHARWLRELYPLEEQARCVLAQALAAGPLSERDLRSLGGRRLEEYVRRQVNRRRCEPSGRRGEGPSAASSDTPLVSQMAEPCPPWRQGGHQGGWSGTPEGKRSAEPRQQTILGSTK